MILDRVLTLITSFVQWVFSPLPSVSVSFTDASSFATAMGNRLAPWNAYLPLKEIASILSMLVTVWAPALLLYVAANWIWRHIPDILGVGPGAG